MNTETLSENKKAQHEYEVLEKLQAGIKLTGPEVKAAKSGLFNLTGSYIKLVLGKNNNNEVWLIGSSIAKYKKSGYAQNSYNPKQDRKLLLTRKEIESLIGKTGQKALTIVPMLVYNHNRIVKLEIALVKSKKQFDKRELLKKREFNIKKQRLIKSIY